MNVFKPIMVVLIFLFIHNACNGLEVIKNNYHYEEIRRVFFEFHLEEISGDAKIEEIIKKLVYNDLNIDDYMAYKTNEFMEIYANDLGSGYGENITVNYIGDLFVIFRYASTIYYADTWYSENKWGYYIIDLREQKTLELNELIQRIPEDELRKIIFSQNDMVDYDCLNTEVWPPDSVSFEKEGVSFSWHSYSRILILPQRYEIYIKIDYEFITHYLTNKGKELMQDILEM
jgi:hypothetical protein